MSTCMTSWAKRPHTYVYSNLTGKYRLTFLVVVVWEVRSKDLDSLLKRISTASLMASTSKGNSILPSVASCHIAVFLAATGSGIYSNKRQFIISIINFPTHILHTLLGEKIFCKTSFQLEMSLEKGQKQGRDERTPEDYPTSAKNTHQM